MRVVLTLSALCLLAATARADSSPPPAPVPTVSSPDWRRIDRAITDYCKKTHARGCHDLVEDLRHRPRSLGVYWDREDGALDVGEDEWDIVCYAKLRLVGKKWIVVEIVDHGMLEPRF